MDIFSTRELAAGIWILVIALLGMASANIRRSLWRLLLSAFGSKLSIVWISGALWTALAVLLLRMLGLWTLDDLKDTVIWGFTAGAIVLVHGFSDEKGQINYGKLVKDLFKVTALIEIIVATYCFSLPTELILLFVLAFLGLLNAYSGIKKEDRAVHQLTNGLLGIILAVVIGHSIMSFVGEPGKVFRVAVLKELAFPVILTFWILPLSYCFGVVAAYEILFIRLRVYNRSGRWFRLRFKLAVIRHFGLSLRNIRAVGPSLLWQLRDVSSIEELRARLKNYSAELRSAEINVQSYLDEGEIKIGKI